MGERLPTKKRKQQLASEALRIIGNKGRAGLTAQSLGHAVGISDGAVFKHFPNMDSIVDAAIDRFQVLLKIEDPGITDPFERLRDFFFSRLALVQANPELLELAFSQSLELVKGIIYRWDLEEHSPEKRWRSRSWVQPLVVS